MPYRHDGDVATPVENEVIWRFMDLPRFLSLLTSSSLWFTMLKHLGDDWEGTQISGRREEELEQTIRDSSSEKTGLTAWGLYNKALAERDEYVASCWFKSQTESMLMWKAYAQDQIAIKSTVGRLKRSLDTKADFFIGLMDYKPPQYDMSPLAEKFLKRAAFADEQEVRVVIRMYRHMNSQSPSWVFDKETIDSLFSMFSKGGFAVPVKLTTLIQEVVTSPQLPDWTHESIVKLVAQFDAQLSVVRSSLAGPAPLPLKMSQQAVVDARNRYTLIQNVSGDIELDK